MTKINQFIKFEPILKQKIWGGDKLVSLLNKKSDKNDIGESWEISDVSENKSIVINGDLKGKRLDELISFYKSDLLGEKVYNEFGEAFPLLIKFIDAKEPLSIQVHPDNEVAKQKHNSFGKTEMWYVMESDENAELVVGFKKDTNEEEYLNHLKNKSLLEILNIDKVKKGDVYFIPAGRVHAIGAGVLLAEIQQTSDLTYRIYDWDRKDKDNNYRELHTVDAVKAINYSSKESYKTNYKAFDNKMTPVVSCPYFTTGFLQISKEININHKQKDSFVVYMCVAGEVVFKHQNKEEKLLKGQTILVPACIKEFSIHSKTTAELLEVYIN